MNINEIREKFINFFKKINHSVIPSASLLPHNDPTTLFTGSGMQPLIPYLLGAKHPLGKRLVNSQKCFRAVDIAEVGDNRHTSFFEMLGNWSLGDYFKHEQLQWFFNFLTEDIKLDPGKLYVTIFSGDKKNHLPKDTESEQIWKKIFEKAGILAHTRELGFAKNAAKVGMQGGRIFYYDAEKNWWSRAGHPDRMPEGEPGGPDSEVFFEFTDVQHNTRFGKYCHPNCDCGRFLEIGNSVFMEYKKTKSGFEKLKQKNVDFGGGLERIAAARLNSPDIFHIDIFQHIINRMEKLSGLKYSQKVYQKSFRIVADHFRAAFFLIADGALPSNTDQGYFVRRLIRRSVRHMDLLRISEGKLSALVEDMIQYYSEAYPDIEKSKETIKNEIENEEKKFRNTLKVGLKEFQKISTNTISGKDAFRLFSSFGLPIDMTGDLAEDSGRQVDIAGFEKEYKLHQEISRRGAEKKFRGGLADHSYATTQGHTATHLLLAALRKVLGEHVFQKGSNITRERLRLDFSHQKKMTSGEIRAVEDLVNSIIKKSVPVTWSEVSLRDAKKMNAMGVFENKYQKRVKVYEIGDFSKEICGGPHVENTGELKTFRILSESSSSSGIRRIKAKVG